ncbi:MAG: choice-of-anchor D domain-containing protein, partial [Burkholderiales bacterium]|nr:choice-of-anchor D domain-containing protein [Burkholderiales bacterium]
MAFLAVAASPRAALAELSGLAAITAGSYHACALTAAGGVKCWGQNNRGQLGDGAHFDNAFRWSRWLPVDVQGLASGVVAVSAGSSHTCALTAAGTVKCWGDNAYGQLGTGDRVASPVPVEVPGLAGVKSLSAGGLHTCAIVAGDILHCWGDNYYGQLGIGSNADSLVPATVHALGTFVAEVSAGSLHTCARTTQGAAKCWGYNEYGQLGDATKVHRNAPVDVTGLSGGVASVVAGNSTSCAVTTGGAAKCWGFNRFNELGDGADPSDTSTWNRTTPVDVVGLASGVAQVVAGTRHGCARMAGGGVKCWGANEFYGEIGDGTWGWDQDRATPVDVVGLSGATALSAGLGFNCALVAGGQARCWGSNLEGQLGSGFDRGIVPRPSVGVPDFQLAVGTSHNLLVTPAGEVWAWGDNTAGKLGNGTTTGSTIPVRALGLAEVVGVSAGMSHSLAVKRDGTVWAWGLHADAQLGIAPGDAASCTIPADGDYPCARVPTQVPGLAGIVAVSAGWRHSLALKADGTVWRWGNDNLGGIGPSSNIAVPEQVPGIGFAVRISAGYMHSVAVESNRDVFAWGRAERGELGASTTVPTGTPVWVAGASGHDAVAGGGFTIVRQDTHAAAWGSNAYGALGDPIVDTTDGFFNPKFRAVPTLVPGMTDVASITAGFGFAGVRKLDGTAWTWGLNNRGQLGNGGAAPDTCGLAPSQPCVRTPANAAAHDGALRLAAGAAHALAIRSDGTIVAFGDNLVGQHGNRGGNYGADPFTQVVYDPDFTLTPGGTFGTPSGVGSGSTTGSLKAGEIGGGIAFGDQAVGVATASLEVVLTNLSSGDPIAIAAVDPAPPGEFALTANGCAGTIAGGASCSIFLAFTPAAAGARSGSLTIASNAANSGSIVVALSGNGIDPRVASTVSLAASAPSSFTGTAVTFTATVNAGAVAPSGTVAFTDGGVAINGCEAVALASSAAACTTGALAAGGHAIAAAYSGDGAVKPSASAPLAHTVFAPFTLSVAKAGTGAGTVGSTPAGIDCGASCAAAFAEGAIVTLAASPAAGAVFAGWSGEGCAGTGSCVVTMTAARSVTATFDAAVAPASLSATPPSLDFGGQSMNTTSPALVVTLTNTGAASITVSSVSASTWFTVAHDCSTLAAGASCTASVTFTPAAQGALNGTLTVQASTGTLTVPLAGTGERSLTTHYYRAILRRAPDAGGRSYWEAEAARVQALGLNPNEAWFALAATFFTSAEYLAFARDDSGFVTDLYTTFFNRAPDAPGLAYWTGQLASGLPREVALSAFMFSTEFRTFSQAIFGSAAVRAEVDTVTDFYRGLLARLPDNAGFAFWLARFRAAQCLGGNAVNSEAESISSQFALSAEYAARARGSAQFV